MEGTPRCLGGEGNPPLAAAPRRSDLLGCAPPPLGTPIYSGGEEGLHTLSPWPLVASFSLPNTSSTSIVLSEALPEYCSSINTTPSCCCWCHLPQPLLPPLLDQEGEDVAVPYVC